LHKRLAEQEGTKSGGHLGSIRAVSVSLKCMYLIKMNTGIMVAWMGTIIVARTSQKIPLRRRNCNFANAYPAIEAVTSWPSTMSPVTTKRLKTER
jgi:hypothetical protein